MTSNKDSDCHNEERVLELLRMVQQDLEIKGETIQLVHKRTDNLEDRHEQTLELVQLLGERINNIWKALGRMGKAMEEV